MKRVDTREWAIRHPWLRLLPNCLTVANSLCGFSAILYTLFAYDVNNPTVASASVFGVSAIIIMSASIFDALDGFTARLFDAISLRGMEMDSLSDMVSFGVAPATLVAVMVHHLRDISPFWYAWVWGFCAMYVACVALRLSKYNISVILGEKHGDVFSGLPCPGAAAALCTVVLFYTSDTVALKIALVLLPFYAAFVSILMVSPIRYLHMGLWLAGIRSNPFRILVVFVICAVGCFRPLYTLFFVVNGYVLSGPLLALCRKLPGGSVRKREKPLNGEIAGE